MNPAIEKELLQIEQREQVRILYAAESGSRAWGFASPDSDYDVRFLYVRPKKEYLRLDPHRDVIERPVDEALDISGWDLPKALRLLHKSNPSLYEWLSSPIVYRRTGFFDRLRPLMEAYFVPFHSVQHYYRMAKRNYESIAGVEQLKAKTYFYILRPLLACRYVLDSGHPAPMPFQELLQFGLPAALRPVVEELLEIKRNAPEQKRVPHAAELDGWITSGLEEVSGALSKLPHGDPPGLDTLNQFFLAELERETESW